MKFKEEYYPFMHTLKDLSDSKISFIYLLKHKRVPVKTFCSDERTDGRVDIVKIIYSSFLCDIVVNCFVVLKVFYVVK